MLSQALTLIWQIPHADEPRQLLFQPAVDDVAKGQAGKWPNRSETLHGFPDPIGLFVQEADDRVVKMDLRIEVASKLLGYGELILREQSPLGPASRVIPGNRRVE